MLKPRDVPDQLDQLDLAFPLRPPNNSRNGARSIERMSQAFPHATLVHLPVHASWINHVEVFFSIVQRKIVKPQD